MWPWRWLWKRLYGLSNLFFSVFQSRTRASWAVPTFASAWMVTISPTQVRRWEPTRAPILRTSFPPPTVLRLPLAGEAREREGGRKGEKREREERRGKIEREFDVILSSDHKTGHWVRILSTFSHTQLYVQKHNRTVLTQRLYGKQDISIFIFMHSNTHTCMHTRTHACKTHKDQPLWTRKIQNDSRTN